MSFKFTPPVSGLEVAQIETSKDKIEQPKLAADDNMYIPPLGSSVVISGKSGSGKSTLLANLMCDKRFYGPGAGKPDGWFDKVFLFSPTANGDDVQKSLKIPKNHVFTDLEEVPEILSMILDTQQEKLDDGLGWAWSIPLRTLLAVHLRHVNVHEHQPNAVQRGILARLHISRECSQTLLAVVGHQDRRLRYAQRHQGPCQNLHIDKRILDQ